MTNIKPTYPGDKLHVAIWEWMGWKRSTDGFWWTPKAVAQWPESALPSYTEGPEARRNLTACLQALKGDDRSLFWDYLYLECECDSRDAFENIWKCLTADDRIWAIALLRVVKPEALEIL